MTELAAEPTGLVFAWPWMLLALVGVPLVVLWYRTLQRERAARRTRLATLGLVAARAERAGWRRRLPPVLLLVALVCWSRAWRGRRRPCRSPAARAR